jgi:hypothetical protein
MLLEFYERCFAGTATPRRSRMALTVGAEGVEGDPRRRRCEGARSATRRVRSGSWVKAVRAGRLGSTL